MRDRVRRRTRHGPVAVVGVGVVLLAVTLIDARESTLRHGASLAPVLVENAPAVALDLSIVATGVWLSRTHHRPRYASRVLAWTGALAGLLVAGAVGVTLARRAAPTVHAGFVFADALAAVVLTGLVVGFFDAEWRDCSRTPDPNPDPGPDPDADPDGARLGLLFENAPNPTLAVDSAGDAGADTVARVNPAFEQYFDTDAAAVEGEPLAGFVVESDVDDAAPYSTAARADWGDDALLLELGGERRRFLKLGRPGDGDDPGFEFYRDVTNQHQRNERLNVLSRTLRHDIRNKMTTIKGNVGSLKDDPDHAKRDELLARTDRAAADILALAERAYEVEQALSGPREREPVDVTDAVETAVRTVEDEFPDCTFEVDAPESATALAVPSLDDALLELVENAAKHADRDEPTVRIEAATASTPTEGVTVSVVDDGPGLSENERQVLTGTRERDQLNHLEGLGLWFVRWVVRDAGGRLTIAENDPRGTRVAVHLQQPADAT